MTQRRQLPDRATAIRWLAWLAWVLAIVNLVIGLASGDDGNAAWSTAWIGLAVALAAHVRIDRMGNKT